MLERSNGLEAVNLKYRLGGAIIADWHKIIDAASNGGAIRRHHAKLLHDALLQVENQAVRSELYTAYFRALEAISSGDPAAVNSAILGLGNVLLEDAANEVVTTPLPLAYSKNYGSVCIPAAGVDICWIPEQHSAVIEPEALLNEKHTLLSAVSSTWIANEGPGVRIRSETNAVRMQIDSFADQTRSVTGVDPQLSVVDHGDATIRQLIGRYNEGLDIIRRVMPEQAVEIDSLTEYVVSLHGRDFVGGTDMSLFGATFLRFAPEWTPLCAADHLTHEAVHQLMQAKQELDPLILNAAETGPYSPIRSDPRPLYGTFQATFVFLRVALLMAEILRDSSMAEWHEEAHIRFHRHLLGLLQGLKVLVDHAHMSSEGEEELDSWLRLARELVSIDGLPDKRIYDKLDWDYDKANSHLPLIAL